jgi:hypothetical protein
MVLKVHAPSGVQVTLRNDYEPAAADSLAWKLPDLPFDAESWAYLKFAVPSVYLADAFVNLPITVTIKAAGAGSTPLFFMASLPTLQRMTRAELMAAAPHPLVERRREELAAGEALELVRRLIARGHWEAAQVQVEKAQRRFASNPWCKTILATMQRMIARRDRFGGKEAAYASFSLRTRLASRDESQFSLAEEASIPAFLRRRGEQGKGRPRD